MSDLGLLLIRLVFGLTFAAHGTQKLFGWFRGHGIAGEGAHFEKLGLKPGNFLAVVAGLGELVSGLLLALGVWSPVAALLISGSMLVAIVKVLGPKGYWVNHGGYEYNVGIITVAVGIALIGPGGYTILSLFH